MERYFATQVAQCSAYIRRLHLEEWFDLWHTHPDFKAKANRAKVLAAKATLELLSVAEQHFSLRKSPIQAFATLCEDTGDNAIYLHSPNPNGTEFPHQFNDVSWGYGLPTELSTLRVAAHYEVGRVQYESGVVHVVRAQA